MELGWEGCLSIPGLRAAGPRYKQLVLRGQDPAAATFEMEVSGFEARVIQHETDHLDGIMYPMRMQDFSLMGFNEELARFQPGLPSAGEDR